MDNTKDDTFSWIPFYEALATKLLAYKNKRNKLATDINNMLDKPLQSTFEGETPKSLEDICPFTVMALFNSTLTDDNRIKIATKFKEYFKIEEEVPHDFGAIPIIPSISAKFFNIQGRHQDITNDISKLWQCFEQAISFSDNMNNTEEFIDTYNEALTVNQTGFAKLTIGLYWIRPNSFLTLDGNSQSYIKNKIKLPISKPVDGETYVDLLEKLTQYFQEKTSTIRSFPLLSEQAWSQKSETPHTLSNDFDTLTEEQVKMFPEGAPKTIIVNGYERNSKARQACIDYYGTTCQICNIDFAKYYGNEFKGMIHVHHLTPLGKITKEYEVNPKEDLITVCPNCHYALHKQDPPYTIDELKQQIQ